MSQPPQQTDDQYRAYIGNMLTQFDPSKNYPHGAAVMWNKHIFVAINPGGAPASSLTPVQNYGVWRNIPVEQMPDPRARPFAQQMLDASPAAGGGKKHRGKKSRNAKKGRKGTRRH